MAISTIKTLYYGDNLQVLRDKIPDQSVDLIYLDPPFNSKKPYNIVFGAEAQIRAFDDTWSWSDETAMSLEEISKSHSQLYNSLDCFTKNLGQNSLSAYLIMMGIRLLELHRVLKPTGSIYLHCDPHASRYLGIVMDNIFDVQNFQNTLTWKRTSAHGGTKGWGRITDNILFYTKSSVFTWNNTYIAYTKDYIEKNCKLVDDSGRRFQASNLTAAGTRTGDSGKPWRGVDPTAKGRHWAINRTVLNDPEIPEATLEALDYLDSIGRIYWPINGEVPRVKLYLDEMRGGSMNELISDIPPLSSQSKERLGYPTQKPMALLERIINCSSNPGDLVLDPFCGCGTAVAAAEKLERNWIGIDITHLAIALVEKRLNDSFRHYALGDTPSIMAEGLAEPPVAAPVPFYEVVGTPRDLDSAIDLARRDKFQFQCWACSLVNSLPLEPSKSKGADRGIDGIIKFHDSKPDGKYQSAKTIIISVKGGENIGVGMIRDLRGVVEREKAAAGIFITLKKPTKDMINEAVMAGFYQTPGSSNAVRKIQILTIEELLNGKKPDLPPDYSLGADNFKKHQPVTKKQNQNRLF